MNSNTSANTSLSSDSKYPTPEEILSGLYIPTRGELNVVTYWQAIYFDGGTWKTTDNRNRMEYIKRLMSDLNAERNGTPYRWTNGSEYSYMPAHGGDAGVISCVVEHPSIISSLHELGHHLFGSDELEACRYAIGLFKAGFPKSFDKLQWQGHMLVKAQ